MGKYGMKCGLMFRYNSIADAGLISPEDENDWVWDVGRTFYLPCAEDWVVRDHIPLFRHKPAPNEPVIRRLRNVCMLGEFDMPGLRACEVRPARLEEV